MAVGSLLLFAVGSLLVTNAKPSEPASLSFLVALKQPHSLEKTLLEVCSRSECVFAMQIAHVLISAPLMQVSDPRSPRYGHYLNDSQIAALVGASPRTVEAARAWIDAHEPISCALTVHRDYLRGVMVCVRLGAQPCLTLLYARPLTTPRNCLVCAWNTKRCKLSRIQLRRVLDFITRHPPFRYHRTFASTLLVFRCLGHPLLLLATSYCAICSRIRFGDQ